MTEIIRMQCMCLIQFASETLWSQHAQQYGITLNQLFKAISNYIQVSLVPLWFWIFFMMEENYCYSQNLTIIFVFSSRKICPSSTKSRSTSSPTLPLVQKLWRSEFVINCVFSWLYDESDREQKIHTELMFCLCLTETVYQPVTCCRSGRWWSMFMRRSST